MRLRVSLYIIGVVNVILAISMLAPLAVSYIFKDGSSGSLIISFAVTMAAGGALFLFKPPTFDITHRDGFVIVTASWLAAIFFGSLPYVFSGALPSFVDALFEAASGLTTTGSSVFKDVETLPKGILLWRSLTHWLGGVGIVVLGIAILPFLGVGGMQVYKAEASDISGEKFAPRVVDIARVTITIYLIFSFTMLVLLIISGMGIYDAFIHTMGTLATGGFSNKNLSIGFYRSSLIEWLTMIFMMAGATNFALHYGFYKTGIKAYTRNEEFRFYILTIVVATIVVAANIYGTHSRGVLEAIRLAGFQVVSIATTTGYATADYTLWPNFAQLVLVLLMLGGGTVGSTAGAIKCVRVLIVLKLLRNEIYRLIHPHAVVPVKLNGKPVPPDVLKGVLSFTILYIMIFFASTAVLSLQGVDIVTAFSSVASCLGGVGPALSLTGPASNYSMLPEFAKVVLMFNMIVGRLELYTLLILFAPSFWRR